MSSRWSHLTKHVRSAETVRKIRANLAVDRHRRRVAQLASNGGGGGDSEGSEHKELMEEIRRMEEQLDKCNRQEEAAKVSLEQQRKDCSHLKQVLLLTSGEEKLQYLTKESL